MRSVVKVQPQATDVTPAEGLEILGQYDEAQPDAYHGSDEEMESALSAHAVTRAVRLNRRYSRTLGWDQRHDDIVRLLGFTMYTPDEPTFAQAVANWQRRQGLGVDGVIGPRTWARMRSAIDARDVGQQPTPRTSAGAPASVAARDRPQGPFGRLTISAPERLRFAYPFTADDVEWTARFIVGEAGGVDSPENRAVIWAMFNRYALFTHRVYRTFQAFIRAYSSPLQPVLRSWRAARRHQQNPRFRRTGGTYPPPAPPGIYRGQLAQFLRLQQTPWRRLRPEARRLAEAALKGQVPNPIGTASEFGNTFVYFRDRYGREPNQEEWRRFTEAYARRKNWRWIGPVPNLNQRGNAFFIDRRAAQLSPDTVRVVPPMGTALGAPTARPTRLRNLNEASYRRIFGSFEYEDLPGRRGAIRILGDWEAKNIRRIFVPQLRGGRTGSGRPFHGYVRVHRLIAAQFAAAFREIEERGLLRYVTTWNGSFVPRYKSWNPRRGLSSHSWGIAFDINGRWNRFGKTPAAESATGTVRPLVPIFEKWGFAWGGWWRMPYTDGMHFEAAKVLTTATP